MKRIPRLGAPRPARLESKGRSAPAHPPKTTEAQAAQDRTAPACMLRRRKRLTPSRTSCGRKPGRSLPRRIPSWNGSAAPTRGSGWRRRAAAFRLLSASRKGGRLHPGAAPVPAEAAKEAAGPAASARSSR
ncbi:hypothetical protein VE23_09190 [Paenibacillus sp. D9]|nr:hypothetical protein VE23_09190 [Paenibacillus sp. D9]